MPIASVSFGTDSPEDIKRAAEFCVSCFNRMNNADMLVLSLQLRDPVSQERREAKDELRKGDFKE